MARKSKGRIEARQPQSILGELLAPDFSDDDLGGTLRSHMMNATTIFRAAKLCAEDSRDVDAAEDLIALGIDVLDAPADGYEDEEMRREEANKPAKPAA